MNSIRTELVDAVAHNPSLEDYEALSGLIDVSLSSTQAGIDNEFPVLDFEEYSEATL